LHSQDVAENGDALSHNQLFAEQAARRCRLQQIAVDDAMVAV